MITRLRKPIVTVTTCSLNPLRTLTRFTSSWSSISPAATKSPPPEGGDGDGGSELYQQSRKFARPATLKCCDRLWNSVSLIGSLEYPVKKISMGNSSRVGAYTSLLVKPSPHSHRYFRITLSMWGSLAERALVHLKQNDYVYVSGQLGTYTKKTFDGVEKTYSKVIVNELNHVQLPDESYLVATKSGSEADARETWEQIHSKRLHLWQLLFANPEEWYDRRETKRSSAHPDFVHKSTGEALWLRTEDPPWVKKQIELLGCRHAGRRSDDLPFGSFASGWVSNHRLPSSDSSESNIITDESYDK